MVKKNSWVRIHRIILEPGERAPQVPEDTKKVPLEMWVKGALRQDAEIGGTAEVTTQTGRVETGILLEENPTYRHSFGNFVPELLFISAQARELAFGAGGGISPEDKNQ
ncbi:MAG: 2-amino-4-ketopentanoate thiolase [Treponema sp.]|jgi:hypothetical protein|nr:2-amino-4-ketopentanoate thiolase [Treponema sp.]